MKLLPTTFIPKMFYNKTEDKPKPNGFDGAVKVVKAGPKDFLRSMRFTLDWGRESYTALKNVKPITGFIKGVKGAEDYLAFGEFFQSCCKVASSVTNTLKHGVTKTYSKLKASALEFIWNLFKVIKCLKTYGVYVFKNTIFTPLMAIGGICFAVNSFDKASKEIIAGSKILNTNPSENNFFNLFRTSKTIQTNREKELAIRDATLAYHVNKTAKNTGTLAVGIIVTLKALFAFTAPGIVMLSLGTMILATNITASIIKESYELKKNDLIKDD